MCCKWSRCGYPQQCLVCDEKSEMIIKIWIRRFLLCFTVSDGTLLLLAMDCITWTKCWLCGIAACPLSPYIVSNTFVIHQSHFSHNLKITENLSERFIFAMAVWKPPVRSSCHHGLLTEDTRVSYMELLSCCSYDCAFKSSNSVPMERAFAFKHRRSRRS